MPVKQIKPLTSICPKCGTENTTTELNFESDGTRPDVFHQSYIQCKTCKYNYILKTHLANPEDKIEIIERG